MNRGYSVVPLTSLKICEWNIRRGLVNRETELKLLLQDEKIDVIFLTETDTKAIQASTDYIIEVCGFCQLSIKWIRSF